MNKSADKRFVYLLLALIGLFVVGRYLGQFVSDNAWSLVHWQFLPGWYGPLWILALVSVGFLFYCRSFLERLSSEKWFLPALAVLLAIILWLHQFDSYLFGGGGHRAEQIGLADQVFLRCFEFGSVLMVKIAHAATSTLTPDALAGAIASWKIVAFLSTILSGLAAWLISRLLSQERLQRLFLSLILFFGPQAVLQFGYVGVEPIIAGVTLWFLYAALRLATRWSGLNLLIMWVILAVGIFCHISLVYLLPAAAFVTLSGSSKGLSRLVPGLIGAGLAFLAVVLVTYVQAGRSLEFRTWILFVTGTPPHTDYSLFSLSHLGDILQIIFLAAPLIVLAFYLRVVGNFDAKSRLMVFTACLSQIGGLVAMLVLVPTNSIPLDFPRLVVFLTPTAVLLAVVLSRAGEAEAFKTRLVPWTAAFVLLLPFATLPIYTQIDRAAEYMTSYLDKHEFWYREVGLTFRDAYFGRKSLGRAEIDKANRWESLLPVRSVDFLNFRGSVYLSQKDDTEEALRQLYYLIVKNPYWTEPREAVANIQMKVARWDRAKPQIDTCLLLEPYEPEHHRTLYSFYRNLKDGAMAGAAIENARTLFPKNKEVATDFMIYTYKSGKVDEALKLANDLIARDNGLPFPYLIRAFAEDKSGNLSAALGDYRAFLTKQKDQPESLMVAQRISQITGSGSGR